MKRLSENQILLCGRKNGCCPIITKIDEENYEVKDDYGNIIKVKKHELEMISDAVVELEKKPESTVIKEQLLCG